MTDIKDASPCQLKQALTGRLRVFDLVDAQRGFISDDGLLTMHAEEVIKPIDYFMKTVHEHAFHVALVKYDTHFNGEYKQSAEAALFPFHCGWGTRDWELVVNIDPLKEKTDTYYMTKNVFDMFNTNPTGADKSKIVFSSADEEFAYDNLFKITSDLNKKGIDRDTWFDENGIGGETTVVLAGVAADYCYRDALIGYVKRGCTVILPTNMTKGISRDIAQVIEEEKDESGASFLMEAYKKNKILMTESGALNAMLDYVVAWEDSGLDQSYKAKHALTL